MALKPIHKTTSAEYFVGECCATKEHPAMDVKVTGGPPGTDKIFCCVWGCAEHLHGKKIQPSGASEISV